jgi:hypothetical protein
MSGDSRHDLHIAVAFQRLSKLLPTIEGKIKQVRNCCARLGLDQSDTIRLDAFDGDFWVVALCDDMALAANYFSQIGLGPDADVVLKEVEEFRQRLVGYSVSLIKIDDTRHGRLENSSASDISAAEAAAKNRAQELELSSRIMELSFSSLCEMFALLGNPVVSVPVTPIADATATNDRTKLKAKQLAALQLIESEGPILGKNLAKQLKLKISSLRTHIMPALKPFGVISGRNGYEIARP